MREVPGSRRARVTASSAGDVSAVGRGRVLKKRSASVIRTRIALGEVWRGETGDLSTTGFACVFSGVVDSLLDSFPDCAGGRAFWRTSPDSFAFVSGSSGT